MKKLLSKLIWLFIAAPAVYLAMTWKKIPEIVPMHYDIKGVPDRYGNKKELILLVAIMSGLSLLIWLLMNNIHRIDPKKNVAENRDRMKKIAFAVTVFMSGISCLIIYSSLNGNFNMSVGFVFAGVGLLFAVIGNYMPNMKPNYFAGLRLPWTLENPENWKKTHALAGKWWFAGGLLIAVICLFTPPVISFIVFITITLAITVVPAVYSYNLYKKSRSEARSE